MPKPTSRRLRKRFRILPRSAKSWPSNTHNRPTTATRYHRWMAAMARPLRPHSQRSRTSPQRRSTGWFATATHHALRSRSGCGRRLRTRLDVRRPVGLTWIDPSAPTARRPSRRC